MNLKNQPNQSAKKSGSEHVADIQPSWSINQRTPNLPKKSPQTVASDGLFALDPVYVNVFRPNVCPVSGSESEFSGFQF